MKLEERGVNLVGVNYKDDIGDALGYLNRGGDPFSMSIQDLSGQFALDLGLTGAPETFIVDGDGIIRQHIIGEINESNWQSRITPCLMVLNDASNNGVSPDPSQVAERANDSLPNKKCDHKVSKLVYRLSIEYGKLCCH